MSLSPATPKFRVAICGAGIGGLVLAVTIGKFAGHNIHIDLYEAQDAITTAGAGIIISRRALEVIKELDLYEEISRVLIKPPSSSLGPAFRRSNAPRGGFEWFHQTSKYPPSHMHRQHLVDILKQSLPSSCRLHFEKRLTRYDKQSSGSLILHFADNSTATTDLLIGADGIRSSVRKTLFETLNRDVVDPSKIGHYADPSWTGTLVYRTVIPAKKLSELDPNNVALKGFMMFCGKGKHVVSYPVSGGTLINVAALVSDEQKAGTPFEGHWVSDVSNEEVQEPYQEFEPAVQNLLKCFENPSRWALHVVNELPLSTYDRVALIGDACHAMTPHLGAGAGQAMEDAFVLGRLLAHPLTTLDNVPAALKAYQDVRLPFAQFVARESARTGRMISVDTPSTTDQGGVLQAELEIQKEKILAQYEWELDMGDVVAEWLEAKMKLQESIGVTNRQFQVVARLYAHHACTTTMWMINFIRNYITSYL
ncbi:FAD/NAD(P)-binding domain-containing protein [Suillus lakei]|nr:FAD/NAD(P)-binding domain-containing protein [Suillus lakei]